MKIIIEGLLDSKKPLMACYKISIDNGFFYYGSSVNVKNRISVWKSILRGKCKSKYNDLFKDAIKKAVFSKIEIVKYFDEKNSMFSYETYLIQANFNSPFSLNLSPSSKNNFGYKKLMNKQHSFPKEIVRIDVSGNVLEEYKSIGEVASAYNTRLSAIQRVLEGERVSHKGMFFNYKNENGKYFIKQTADKKAKKPKRSGILQLSILGDLVNKYKTIREAAASVGLSTASISFSISGRQKTSGGYKWQYA